jgi:hypothetical protein
MIISILRLYLILTILDRENISNNYNHIWLGTKALKSK